MCAPDQGEGLRYINASADMTSLTSRHDLDSTILGLADPAMLIAADHRILLANDPANELFGWEGTGLTGQLMDVLLPEPVVTAHHGWSEGFFNKPTARIMGENPRLEGVRRNGERVPLDISLSPIRIIDEFLVLVIIRDLDSITSRHSIPLNELSPLIEIARVITGPMETVDIFKRVARQIRPLIPYDQLFICALDQNSTTLRHHYIVGHEITGHETGSAATLTASQMSSLRSMTRPSIFVDEAVPAWFEDINGQPGRNTSVLKSMLTAPLRWDGEVIGTLILRSRSQATYGEESAKLSEQIASVLASVVARSRYRVMVAESIDQRSILANIGRQIGDAADFRPIFSSLATQIDQLIPIDRLVICSVNIESGSYVVEAEWRANDPDVAAGHARDLTGTWTEKAILANRPTIFTDELPGTPGADANPESPDSPTVKSRLTVPLKLRGQTIGVMHFKSYEFGVYEAVHLDTAQQISAQFAPTTGNAPVTLDHERERKIRRSVVELARAVVRGDGLEAIAEAVKDQLSKFVEFDRFSSATMDKETAESSMFYQFGDKLSGINTGEKIQFAGLIASNGSRIDTVGENEEIWKDRLTKSGLHSWMYTVVGSDSEQPVGVIWVGARRRHAFDDRDLEILDRLTSVMVPQFHGFAHETARRRLAEEHQRSEVLEYEARAKSEFVSSISHELKNPLTSVIAFSSLLQRDKTLNDRQLKQVDLIHKNAWRLERMIEDLLEIARANAGKLSYAISEVQVSSVVKETCEGLQPVARNSDRRLSYNCPESNATAAVDPTRLAQVLQNLIGNAIKYSPNRTGVTISTEEVDGKFMVLVRNRGTLTEEELNDAFVRFKRLDNEITRATSGTGLGLSISRQIIEEMGGSLSLGSNDGIIEARLCVPILNREQS